MATVDARGLSCPQPVILARKAIEAGQFPIETSNATIDAAYCEHYAGVHPGEFVVLAVSDDGSGMDQEIQEHVFEPFFTTKGVGEGTGLGLATVYGIVKQNDGFINVYSELDKGTEFRVYLPRHEGAVPWEDATKAPVERPRGAETILLVEDEKPIRTLMRRLLEQIGYTVVDAANPEAAIRLVGSGNSAAGIPERVAGG